MKVIFFPAPIRLPRSITESLAYKRLRAGFRQVIAGISLLISLSASALLSSCSSDSQVSADEARAVAKEAMIYGFPIYENYKVFRKAMLRGQNINTFYHNSEPADPEDTTVVSPNNDTPYSYAFLDLRAEPLVFEYGDLTDDRFFMFQFVDAMTNNAAYIGAGQSAKKNPDGNWSKASILIVGKSQSKNISQSLKSHFDEVIELDGDYVFLLGRTQLKGMEDISTLEKNQQTFKLTPLSEHPGTLHLWDTGNIADVNTSKDFITPYIPRSVIKDKIVMSVNDLNIISHMLTLYQGPYDSESDLMKRLASIEVGEGYFLDADKLGSKKRAALELGMRDAILEIQAKGPDVSAKYEGWTQPRYDIDYFCDGNERECTNEDYLLRSAFAFVGLYVNSPTVAVYPTATETIAGEALTTRTQDKLNRYELTFEQDKLPPAEFFSSITVYDSRTKLLIDNEIDRYSLDFASELNAKNGQITLYIQSEPFPPEDPRRSNWLPLQSTPQEGDGFYLIIRVYGPVEAWNPLLSGNAVYRIPGISKAY